MLEMGQSCSMRTRASLSLRVPMTSDTQSAETRMAIETLRADTPTLFRPCKQLALLELISDA